jgi:response regulator RpfG family c-di-GMP phosphodiesterase
MTETPARPVQGTVLLVDDDEALLAALSRLLRPDGLRVLIANSGERGLELLEAEGDVVGVVVSDYSMPSMNGADFLRTVRLRWPDATRMLATGNADLSAAANAVNEGQVARLITKPCDPDQFRELVAFALGQHQLVLDNRQLRVVAEEQAVRLEQWNQRLEDLVTQRTAELEKANSTLQRGLLDTVRLLVGFLERRVPERAARCRDVAKLAGRLAEKAGMSPDIVRRIQVAALVHDIGLMSLSDPVLRQRPDDMPAAAKVQYEQHPAVGQSMLAAVDQLVEIATWIRHHHERWDGRGYPDRLAGPAIPMPSRFIALADGYLEACSREGGTAPRWRNAQRGAGAYDPSLLEVLSADIEPRAADAFVAPSELLVPIEDLQSGSQVAAPIEATTGVILVNAGDVLTEELIGRIQALAGAGVVAVASVRIVTDHAA